ncbi:MAG: hypothetical protein V3V01_08560 [Acidimicrobiales bacterium]
MPVRVEGPTQEWAVEDSETLDFGRAKGRGCITVSDRTVSEHHGTVHHFGGSWAITSTGSYLGFSVHDVATAAAFEIPLGAGPVTVPFAHAIVVVAGREARHALSIHGPVATTDQQPSIGSGSTVPIVDRAACVGRNGHPLRWFQVLTALCENALSNPGMALGSVASDNEIRKRLGIGSSTLERALTRARQELGFAPHTPQLRVVMATTAIAQGVVTPADLKSLD